MKIFRLVFLAITLLALPLSALSQSRVLTGVVSDKNGTIAGVAVYLENKDQRILTGVTTGAQGEYIMTIPDHEKDITVVVSFVGLKTVKVPYTGQKVYNVRLAESTDTSISTVVVTGKTVHRNNMGIKREDLGTATERIDVSEFEDMTVTSIEDMMQGKMANLDIVAASGDPGTSSTIRIRGSASLNASNEPLIVIDGIPQDTQIDADFDFGDADVEDFGALVNISPNDIQTIEILKDAAATALWGPKAANGVLIITTKQGGNHKPRFSFSQKMNYTFEPKALPMLNGQEYVTLMQDALWNWIKDGEFLPNRVNKLNNQKDILYDQSYEFYNEFNQNTDWVDLITKSSLNTTSDFSMDGGGEKASYRFSLGYEGQSGTTKKTDYSRITSRLNIVYRFSNKFRVNSQFSYAESTRNQPFEANSGDLNTPARTLAIRKMPNMSPWVLDANGNPTDEYFTQPSESIQGNTPNPLALVNESLNKTLNRSIGASFGSTYNLAKGLTASATISFTMSTVRNNKFLPSSVLNVKWSHADYNRGVEALTNKVQTYAEARINYDRTFNKVHRMAFSLAEQIDATSNNSYSLTTSGNGGKEVSSPSAGGKITGMTSGWSKQRSVGFTGVVNYNFKELYSVTFSARLNANSNTGRNNRWRAPRPSISAVWKAHNEKFLRKAKWMTELRLRGSWGQSERVPNSNFTTGTFSYETDYMDKTSIRPNQMQLDKLKPEVVTQYNLGLDGTLWGSKVNFTFELYNKTTTDLLQKDSKIQSTTGYETIRFFNSGSMRNHGWEIMFNFNNILKAGDFVFSLRNLNLSRNVNKITELPSNMEPERYSLGNSNYARKIIKNNPIGSMYGFLFDGIYQNYDQTLARDANGDLIRDIYGNTVVTKIGGTWQQRPGDAKYADINHDGIINEYDIVYLGNSYPTLTGGGSLNVAYKSWSLRVSLHFRLGQSIINMVRHETEKMNNGYNQSKMALARWRYEGDQTDIPRALWGTNYNSLGSDKFVEDGSFMKIKDITLNYRLPVKFLKKIGLTRANAFLTTYNIFTITRYSGQDPEVNVEDGAFGLAIDKNRTPPAQRVAMGISFDF